MALSDYRKIAPLAYAGKEGCEDVRCRRISLRLADGSFEFGPCMGWHCSYCDKPCSSMGCGCETSKAMIEAATKIAAEESA